MVKSERKFASEVTMSVPRSVLKDDEMSKPEKGGRVPPWDVRHPDGGLERPSPTPLVPRSVLMNWRETTLSL